ncbi:ABC transporter ATP-binding protein [Corynebacterium sp. LK2510]|uniref:ABC transporter ATP-binding protein n=1 Tax=Corynebacterium sp. LK2510 TaxID=3110472 RepID=UPI0034CD6BC0
MISLELSQVATGYGRTRIVDNLTASPLRGGTVVGLLGPNASGKSTLIKTIAGVHPLIDGTIALTDGTKTFTGRELRDIIGYVPQDLPRTAALTAFETVAVSARRYFPPKEALHRAAAILHELEIPHLAQKYLSDMSGGQRQLVAVAQMLVSDPSVMLLDEPTSALDLHWQLFVLAQLRQRVRANDSLAIVAIHDMNLAARFCDELIVLHKGVITAQGAPSEIMSSTLLQKVYQVETEILDHVGVPVVCAIR